MYAIILQHNAVHIFYMPGVSVSYSQLSISHMLCIYIDVYRVIYKYITNQCMRTYPSIKFV